MQSKKGVCTLRRTAFSCAEHVFKKGDNKTCMSYREESERSKINMYKIFEESDQHKF